MKLSNDKKQAFRYTKGQDFENSAQKVKTNILLLQRKTLIRDCLEFVKVDFLFVEKVNSFNSHGRESRVASNACTQKKGKHV